MKIIKKIPIVIALSLVVAVVTVAQQEDYNGPAPTRAEDYNWYVDGCPSLHTVTMPEVATYLNGVTPNKDNAICITYAMIRIADTLYRPAIPGLVKLLDFQRPDLPYEHYWKTTHILPDKFPARSTLELIGLPAVPAVLDAIGADSTTQVARSNAIQTVMMIYGREVKLNYPLATGITRLEERAANAKDSATGDRFREAVKQGLESCLFLDYSRRDQTDACWQAARTGTVPDQAPPTQQ